MKKEYWIILIAYIAMQLSSLFGVPLVLLLADLLGQKPENMQILAVAYWLVISFTITLIITLLLLRKEMKMGLAQRDASSAASAVGWAIGGIFLALIAQATAASIENMIGVEMGSENTQQIIRIIEASPVVILISSVVGPILEEIVFRKIIFGSLHKRFNFFLSALISSVIFALAHFEPEHILLYSAMGFTFAFLYVKTKRIIVPIFAHVAMNTLVAVIQLNQENLEKWMKEMENVQSFISCIAV
ncbi:CPBP family intramembrane metalloprotease [Bacillus sp. ISL-47]|uniref:CPBP family intramembrane glutamic endopeptidase n=1 Tax=Bacillus sp. ISL-47 TaxID=2819130 RepID=UPI001BE7EB76|nr:CPBP family intramembrane glutamic endopeptidase [Bacillus sp. ISL-47]MBT2690925.1 CPBP family intramembrane metalloprotease [Bacillus sp. ISL-47]MBT2706710.1 CPBP family intramembrane metalloprotease [Pseudomonas sp. ISL-84]